MQPYIKRKEIAPHEADGYFYHSIQRTVKNDCTIVFRKTEFEVPAKYIGRKIEIRFPLDNQEKLSLFEDNIQIHALTKLDKHFNSENTIRYSEDDGEGNYV